MKKILYLLLVLILIACQSESKKNEALRAEAEKIHDKGLIKLQAGNMEEALALFNQAIEIDETFDQPHVNKVEVYLNSSEYKKAIKEINIITEKAPQVAENWVLAGIFEEKKGNQEKAFEHYRTSIEKFKKRIETNKKTDEETDSEDFDSLVGIVFSYILLEDYEQVDSYIALLEEDQTDEQMIEFLLDFNKETYLENIFPDFN